MITASCPSCKTENTLGSNPEIGMRLVCSKCQKELELIWLFPPILDDNENDLEAFVEETRSVDVG